MTDNAIFLNCKHEFPTINLTLDLPTEQNPLTSVGGILVSNLLRKIIIIH